MTGRSLAACALALLAAACGSPQESSDAGMPDAAAAAGADASHGLQVEPRSPERHECVIEFGFVQTGKKATASLVFKNLGSRDEDVSSFAFVQDSEMGAAFALEPGRSSLTVRAGATEAIPLTFAPGILGSYDGKLTFETTDAELPEVSCALWGTGGGPVIDVQPAGPVDLGAVNGIATSTLKLSNLGTQITGTTDDSLKLAAADPASHCTVNEHCPGGFCLRGNCWKESMVELEIVEGSASALVVQWPPEGYVASGIAAGQSVELKYTFAPKGPEALKANLKIRSNDPEKPLVVVEISGSGV